MIPAVVATGRECDVVILTTVRSLPEEDIPDHPSHSWVNEKLGFVTSRHLINVAITRAKEALCIIGKYSYSIQENYSACKLSVKRVVRTRVETRSTPLTQV